MVYNKYKEIFSGNKEFEEIKNVIFRKKEFNVILVKLILMFYLVYNKVVNLCVINKYIVDG